MAAVEMAPQIQLLLDEIGGETTDQKIAHLLLNELRRYLEECEREMLDLEIKYGLTYEEFKAHLEAGKLGDPFSYPLEQDAMRWDDLMAERQHWLSRLKTIKGLLEPEEHVPCEEPDVEEVMAEMESIMERLKRDSDRGQG